MPRKLTDSLGCPLTELIQREYFLKETGKPLKLVEHQERILSHCFTPRSDGTLPYTTIVYSAPKKSGKTEIGGAITYASCRLYGGDAISVANDEEQAESRMFRRVAETLRMMKLKSPKVFGAILDEAHWERIVKNGIITFADDKQLNPGPHVLRYIANDYAGEAGAMNALVLFDELWAIAGERGMRLWTELQPIPTLPVSIRVVTTYAGFYGESELLWGLYEGVVQPDPHTDEPMGQRVEGLEDLPCYRLGRTFIYWDHEARMPWHTPIFLEEARSDPSVKGRESEFRRLWENRWTTGQEAFLDINVIDRRMAEGKEMGLMNHLAGW